jgi:hypothetical protein
MSILPTMSIGLVCRETLASSRYGLFTLLSQITSPRVVTVRLRVGVEKASDLGVVDWLRMDQILSQC